MNRSLKNSERTSKGKTKRGSTALKVFSLVVLLVALLFVCWELFKVRNIEVYGCENIAREDIIALSEIEYGQSSFLVDTEKIKEALASDSYIKPVDVTVRYPDCIEITIEERAETACIKKNGELLVIDDECWLLKIIMNTETAPYTLVLGLNLDELIVGERLSDKDTYRLDVLSAVLITAKENDIKLESVDMSLAADVIVKTAQGYTVELGNDTKLKEKFLLAKSASEELADMGKTGCIIDVSTAEKAYCR